MKVKLTLLALTVALYGCSDSSSSRAPEGPATSNVSGAVTKGPVAGATVNVFVMDESGQASGEPVAGPIVTGGNGDWSVEVPDNIARPLLVVATGGSYTDEATGGSVDVGERSLSSFLADGATTSSISPASEVVVRAARRYLSSNPGSSVSEGVDSGRRTLQSSLGASFDPLTVIPNPRGSDTESRQYAALLGGLSTLTNNQTPSADPLDAALALVTDASDGELDGEADGQPVAIGDSGETLPSLNATNLTDAINTYTADPENGDFDDITTFSVSSSVTAGSGTVTPESVSVFSGAAVTFDILPATGQNLVGTPQGCPGSLTDLTFTTDPLAAACTLSVAFETANYTVSAVEVTGGTTNPQSQTVAFNQTASMEFNAETGYDLVSATGCGGSLIGATYTTGAVTGDCTVTPVFELQQQTVAINITGNGTTDPDTPVLVDFGEKLEVTLIPAQGFAISDVSTSDGDVCPGTLNDDLFTIDRVSADCELNVTYTPVLYTATVSVSGPGSATPASAEGTFGDSVSFQLNAEEGAALADANGCNGALSGNVYTTAPLDSNCNVTAEFRTLYTVTATAGANGSISPGSVTALAGEAKEFTVTPDSDYQIDTVTGCGGSLTGNRYLTAAITTNCEINATFTEIESDLPTAEWDAFNWDEASWQ